MVCLVTGGCGFIGSFMSEHLAAKGIQVVVTDKRTKSIAWPAAKAPAATIEGDLVDQEFIKTIFERYRPTTVIHAAWSGVLGDARNAPEQIENLVMTKNLLEACVHFGIHAFIGFGSQAEYGVHNARIDEECVPKPETLYGVFKLSAGLLGQHYARRHKFNYAWLRLFSTFGPADDSYYVIPYTIRCFLKGEKPKLTTCEQKWDYLYIRDIPRLVSRILETNEPFCGIYNLCSGRAIVLRDIIETVRNLMGAAIEPEFGAVPQRDNSPILLEGENRRFRETFGWIDLTEMSDALSETVSWFSKNQTVV